MNTYLVEMRIWGRYKAEVDAAGIREAEEAAFSGGDFGDLCNIDGAAVLITAAGSGRYEVHMHISGTYCTEVEAGSQKDAEALAFDKGDFKDLYDVNGSLISAELAGGQNPV